MEHYLATFRMGQSDFTCSMDVFAGSPELAAALADFRLAQVTFLKKECKTEMILESLEKIRNIPASDKASDELPGRVILDSSRLVGLQSA